MKVTITSDLKAEFSAFQRDARRLDGRIKQTVRKASFALERRVKQEMPVDTGRARASWGHWSPEMANARTDNPSNPSDAYWEEKDDGLTIEQGSNVEYIEALNDGHSQQAPAGFLDLAEEEAQLNLNAEIDKVIWMMW